MLKQLRKQVGFSYTWTTRVSEHEKAGEVHILVLKILSVMC